MKSKLCIVLVLILIAFACILCACHEHQFGEWTTVRQATCTELGLQERYCSCGQKDTQEITNTGHNYQPVDTKSTCTEQGYITYTCSCGDSYVDDYKAPLGHTEIVDKGYDSTCTTDGLTDGSHCGTCGVVIVEQTVIEALGHEEISHSAKDPTCSGVGWNEHVTCSRCDYTTYQEIPATGHTFDEWQLMEKATCTMPGLEERFCNCGERETRPIEPTGHTFGNWVEITPRTCTEDGLEERYCECGETEQNILDALGHYYQMDSWAYPTCTEKGYANYVCIYCWDVQTDYDDPLGHDTTTHPAQAPTCTEAGWAEYETCSRCSYSTFEATNAIGHNYVDGFCTNCQDSLYSSGLQYTLSADGTYYILSSLGNCTDTEIVIPETYENLPVKEIGEIAFADSNITSVTIPSTITKIGYDAFANCKQLSKVIITDIAAWCNISIPSNTYPQKIAKHLYLNDEEITHLVIPEGVTTLHSQVFAYCEGLVSVSIPSTVTSIGLDSGAVGIYSFQFCPNLEEINVSPYNPNYKSVDGVLYSKDGTTLIQYPMAKAGTQFTVPSDVTKIYAYGFYSCTNLTTINFGENSQLVSIGNSAFWKCSALTTINWDNCTNLTTLYNSAFADCTSLTTVTIPASITRILPEAFLGCTSLTSVTFQDTNYWWRSGNRLDVTDPLVNAKKLKDKYWFNASWVEFYASEWTKKTY